MKPLTTIFKTLLAIFLFAKVDIQAQNCVQTSQYPSSTINIAQSGSTTVTTCNFGGEFSVNNFTTVGTYTITGSGGAGNYFTVTDNSNNVVVSGATPLAVTIPSVGLYRIHVSTNSSCGTDGSCHTIIVNRVLPPCVHTSQYPSVTTNISQVGNTPITTCNFGGEYSVNSFTTAGNYTINASGGTGNYLTVTDNSNNVVLSGNPPLAVTIPSVGLYRIHVSTNISCGTESACHTISVDGVPPPSVPNDFCSAAILMSVPSSSAGTTVGATVESPSPGTCGTTLNQPGVWYKVVGNGNQFGADLCAAAWDSKIFVYTGSCGAWNCVTGNDDAGPMCNTSSAASVTWCSVPSTTYYILATGYSSANAFTIAITQTVNASNPTVTAVALTPSVCLGSAATLSASGASTYSWSNGATSASIAPTPTASTVYTVIGWGSVGCGYNIKTVTVTSLSNPTVTISSNSGSICPGGTFTVTASGASSYTFSGSPSGTIVATTATLSPIVNTTYTVSGTAANGCKSLLANSPTATVITLASPTLVVSATPTAICPGASANLNVSGANSYTWVSPSSNSTQVSVSPAVTTIYTVSGTGTTVCNGIKTITLTVYPTPTISVNSSTICSGNVFTMTPSGASTYSYANGSNTIAPTTNTTINVTGTSSNGCVSAPVVAGVTVVALPVVTVNSGTVCEGSQYIVSPLGATNYTFIGFTNPISPTVSGSYSVIGTNSTGCVSLPAISNVTVFAKPILSVAATPTNMVICNNDVLSLTASGANTYTWNNATSGATYSSAPATSSNYFVIGTDANGCTNFVVVPFTVNPLPPVSVNANTFICLGNSSTITALGASSYSWTNAAATNSIVVSPSVSTIYGVTGTSTLGCSKTATISIQVNTIVLVVSSNTAICIGNTVVISALGANNYTWSPINSLFSTIPVSPSVTTTYSFNATDSKQCSHSGAITVSVNPIPVIIALGSDSLICAGETATMNATGGSTYVWSVFGSTVGTGSSFQIQPNVNTIYVVTGTDSNGCFSTDTVSIKVDKCTGLVANKNNLSGLTIYPNPTNGEFTIDLNNGRIKDIQVLDVTGRVVIAAKSEEPKTVVSLIGLANGVYYVKIQSNNNADVIKVIKH